MGSSRLLGAETGGNGIEVGGHTVRGETGRLKVLDGEGEGGRLRWLWVESGRHSLAVVGGLAGRLMWSRRGVGAQVVVEDRVTSV